jgi:hypothetical protein
VSAALLTDLTYEIIRGPDVPGLKRAGRRVPDELIDVGLAPTE